MVNQSHWTAPAVTARAAVVAALLFCPAALSEQVPSAAAQAAEGTPSGTLVESELCRRLEPLAQILDQKDYYTWDPVPLDGPDGKVHLYFSRWPAAKKMAGWLTASEVAHAVADRPEGPYRVTGVVLRPAGGDAWDADTVHNPQVQKIGEKYVMVYMGRRNERGFGQFTGIAVADKPEGPFERVSDRPVIPPSEPGAWDDNHQSNPTLLVHPNGQFWLYYKGRVGEKRSVGLAIADRLEGPYRRHPENPIIVAANEDLEDYFVYREDGKFKMLIRDRSGEMLKDGGMYYQSDDGVHWSQPTLAFYNAEEYFVCPKPGAWTRMERPFLLIRDGRPAYLFLATSLSRYGTTSAVVFKVHDKPLAHRPPRMDLHLDGHPDEHPDGIPRR